MSKQIQFHQTGSPDVLKIVEISPAEPKSHEVQIKMSVLGLNRAEAMYRAGVYVIEPIFPATMGYEGQARLWRWARA
ncbi:hypothetical protein SAMN02745664_10858 [Moraxella cuniculi DSM 21768]|uniref:NADPH2:quinone reductase n=1 Tax=Moraxella cuniculi DSM 21768 TaxID=1122245 RepID=A0A1N7EYG0_9GAMM|nr:hypothetical protein [Moraxella cuniculi]OOS02304.1 hypothetical protein B0189_10610 [Moraxella cuniculi]SIR93072.1 hypothetical protein SAMN02745664_10858 [Moraxella cuniculi DSM 21768]